MGLCASSSAAGCRRTKRLFRMKREQEERSEEEVKMKASMRTTCLKGVELVLELGRVGGEELVVVRRSIDEGRVARGKLLRRRSAVHVAVDQEASGASTCYRSSTKGTAHNGTHGDTGLGSVRQTTTACKKLLVSKARCGGMRQMRRTLSAEVVCVGQGQRTLTGSRVGHRDESTERVSVDVRADDVVVQSPVVDEVSEAEPASSVYLRARESADEDGEPRPANSRVVLEDERIVEIGGVGVVGERRAVKVAIKCLKAHLRNRRTDGGRRRGSRAVGGRGSTA